MYVLQILVMSFKTALVLIVPISEFSSAHISGFINNTCKWNNTVNNSLPVSLYIFTIILALRGKNKTDRHKD